MKRIKQLSQLRIIIMILVILLGLGSVAVAQDKVSIEINYKVKADNQNLMLGDIATIQGSKEIVESLQNINLGTAPLPGYTRILKSDYILSSLLRAGFDLNQFTYEVPRQVRVTTPHQLLNGEKLVKKVKKYIYKSLDFKEKDIEVEVLQVPNQIKLPLGEVKLQIGRIYSQSLLGRRTIPINIYVDNKLVKKKHVQLRVTAYQKVLVAKDLTKRHQHLSKKLFKWERRSISNLHGNHPFAELASIQKFRLKRTINSGQVLTKEMVERPPLVKRRSKITIIAEVGGIRVTTKGIALDSGIKGEIIEVENLNSGREFMAEVWGKDTVKVNP
jgi:flagella basal body P-ring formation protein FlgA